MAEHRRVWTVLLVLALLLVLGLAGFLVWKRLHPTQQPQDAPFVYPVF